MKTLIFFLTFLTSAVQAQTYTQQIDQFASGSSCARYSWKNRGVAPLGFIKGISLSFARALCERNPVLFAAESPDARHDALTHYSKVFQKLGLRIDKAGPDTLRALYVLGMGEGMRESSGAYCAGWDTSAGSRRPSSTGEAGVFQASYDAMGASIQLPLIYKKYLEAPDRCLLPSYKEGAHCSPQHVLGTGPGADFQTFTKVCPAFSTDYAMVLMRVLSTHFGPIIRLEAEVVPACNQLLFEVQSLVEQHLAQACAELD